MVSDRIEIRLPRFLSRFRDPIIPLLLGFVMALTAWGDRSMLKGVFFPNDSSMHESMVRFATTVLGHGHWPMNTWYPYLDLGSPQFLHYQPLGAMLAGGLGLLVGANGAFHFTLWAMVVCWPLVIYKSARIFGLSPRVALVAGVIAPFVFSVQFVGYEPGAYLWIGYGVWAQLCASMALPFAWAYSWRALGDRTYLPHAVFFIAFTSALHYETGYSAFAGVALFALVHNAPWRTRLRHALITLGGAGLATAWVLIPLFLYAPWAALNTALASTPLVQGYGASQNLSWLLGGHLFDEHRIPILTILLCAGLASSVVLWRADPLRRAFLLVTTVFFMILWGHTTWGPLINLLPGHADIYVRRFLLTVHLGGIYLIAVGLAWIATSVVSLWPRLSHLSAPRVTRVALALTVVTLALAIPRVFWFNTSGYDQRNQYNVWYQQTSEAAVAGDLAAVVNYLHAHPDGRAYAGSPLTYGANFKVGEVPMYMVLTANDIDQVGFFLRTAALMEQPEYLFRDNNVSDYIEMGVRYIVLPTTSTNVAVPSLPRVPATRVLTNATYTVWVVPQAHYINVGVASGSLHANKGSLFAQAPLVQDATYFENHVVVPVTWGGNETSFVPPIAAAPSPGEVTAQWQHLSEGRAGASVTMHSAGVVYLSASFDPGWQVTVDGQPATTMMVAPALVGVAVSAGHHTITFTYHGFGHYAPLLLLAALSVTGVWWWSRRHTS